MRNKCFATERRQWPPFVGIVAVLFVAAGALDACGSTVSSSPSEPTSSATTAAVGSSTVARRPAAEEEYDLVVFMRPDATEVQIEDVRRKVEESAEVEHFDYIDHAAAYAEFRELFADQPDVQEDVTPESLPTSFRIELRDDSKAKALADRLKGMPGVKESIVPTRSVPPVSSG